jgi:hypothetical protein
MPPRRPERCQNERPTGRRHLGLISFLMSDGSGGLCRACGRALMYEMGGRTSGNTRRGTSKRNAGSTSSENKVRGKPKRDAGSTSSGNKVRGKPKRDAGSTSSGNKVRGKPKRDAGSTSFGNKVRGKPKRQAGKRSGLRRAAKIALVVQKAWLDKIFASTKTWEIRGTSTKCRGLIHFAQSGYTGKLIGSARLVDCIRVPRSEFMSHKTRHGVPSLSYIKYKDIYAWVLRGARRYAKPFTYTHVAGAIVWVRV